MDDSEKVPGLAEKGWAVQGRGDQGSEAPPMPRTYFICLTMVLFPDSPAPGTEGTGSQRAGRWATQASD